MVKTEHNGTQESKLDDSKLDASGTGPAAVTSLSATRRPQGLGMAPRMGFHRELFQCSFTSPSKKTIWAINDFTC